MRTNLRPSDLKRNNLYSVSKVSLTDEEGREHSSFVCRKGDDYICNTAVRELNRYRYMVLDRDGSIIRITDEKPPFDCEVLSQAEVKGYETEEEAVDAIWNRYHPSHIYKETLGPEGSEIYKLF